MMTSHELIACLVQRSDDGKIRIIVRGRDNNLYEIESTGRYEAKVPFINDDLRGPLAHNEQVLVLDIGPAITQRVQL